MVNPIKKIARAASRLSDLPTLIVSSLVTARQALSKEPKSIPFSEMNIEFRYIGEEIVGASFVKKQVAVPIKFPWYKSFSVWIQRLFYSQRRADAELAEICDKHLRGVIERAMLGDPRAPFWDSNAFKSKPRLDEFFGKMPSHFDGHLRINWNRAE